jgi:carbamoyltransferase
MAILSLYPLPGIVYTHDGSATLISEGNVLYSYEEEKLSRFQHAISEFPEKAAVVGFQQTGIHPTQVESLVVTSIENCLARPDFASRVQFAKDLLLLRDDIDVTCVPHHMAHSALAVLTSPFDECVFLTMDGGGDYLMGHWGVFRDGAFDVVEEFKLSPAHFFTYLMSLAGFSNFEEGKLMGLSAFGKIDPYLLGWLREHFWIQDGSAAVAISPKLRLTWQSSFRLDAIDAGSLRRAKYSPREVDFTGPPVIDWASRVSPVDIAATGQHFFELLVLRAVKNIRDRTGIEQFALGGGAFLNVLINEKLRREANISTYIPVAPHDAGLSLGAALLKSLESTGQRPHCETSAYLGPKFDRGSVTSLLAAHGLRYEEPKDIATSVAHALADGKVVGFFHGKAEFGARALGSRSVLADPREESSKFRLNQALKKRDWFMPYAPTILEEHGNDFFEGFIPAPYMNMAFRVRPEKAHLIPAAIHVDGTCRAQSVNEKQNPLFYRLISQFAKITGVPMVLNTSFNRHGVPIVATPRQAIEHLLEGSVDLLAIEGYLVSPLVGTREIATLADDTANRAWDHLKWVAHLLEGENIDAAREYLERIELPIKVSNEGISLLTEIIWAPGEPLDKLKSNLFRYMDGRQTPKMANGLSSVLRKWRNWRQR